MHSERLTVDGCAISVAEAVHEFRRHWKGKDTRYSTRPSRYSLFALVQKTVWPSWTSYLKSLPSPFRELCRELNLKNRNFRHAANRVIEVAKTAGIFSHILPTWREFEATLYTMLAVLEKCAVKQAVEDPLRHIPIRHTGHPDTCIWTLKSGMKCGELTEYEAYSKGFAISNEAVAGRTLSRHLCARHCQQTESTMIETPHRITKISSKSADNRRWRGQGLCKFCGRLTERDALLDAEITGLPSAAPVGSDRRRTSPYYCAEHRPTCPGESNAAYLRALRHHEEFIDLRMRLQKQSRHDLTLRQLSTSRAVNWFESYLVRSRDLFSLNNHDPRKAALHEAEHVVRVLAADLPNLNGSEVLDAVTSFVEAKQAKPEETHRMRRDQRIQRVLTRSYAAYSTVFIKAAVLRLFSKGVKQEQIAKSLFVPERRVALIVRRVLPKIAADADETELSRAALELIRNRITDRKKEIVYYLAKGMNQSQIASEMVISRAAVSKALASIPEAYRFDKIISAQF